MGKFLSLPRLAVLGLALGTAFLGLAPAFAQAPPAVPALPDTERRVAYSLTSQTGPFSVTFALYGDSTDYADWLTVSLCTSAVLNPCSVLTGVTDWTLSSATGSLATIPRPITDATITLTTARTGTLQITGARRPRRTSQFAENRGVAARDLNQVITDLVAQNREDWDLQQRQLRGQPGELISALQPAITRAGGILCWDSTGLIPNTCAAGSSGTANVVGPNVSVVGHIATYGNTTGTILLDGGLVGAGDVVGPASSVANHVPTFAGATGKILKDSGLTISPSTGGLTIANGKVLTVDKSIEFDGTDGTLMTFPTTSATIARTDAANTFTGHQTIEGVTTTGATGTGKLVFDTAPVLGAITVTSINKMAVTAPATSSTLAVADGKTATHTATTTFAGTDGKTLTISNSGTLAGGDAFVLAIAAGKTLTANSSLTLTGVDAKTLTVNNSGTLAGGDAFTLAIAAGKTLTASNSLTLAGTDATTITFQGTDTYVGRTTTDTLTNKTLTAPTINAGTAQALTNLGIRSTGTGAFDLVFANSENLTAQRTLTLTLNNAPRTASLSGNLTLAADFITSGANALTLTTTGTTNVTLPISGTLATQNTANTFSSTNTFSALQQFTDIKFSSGKLYPTSNSTTALQITQADGTTAFVTFDSTNKRVGINKTPGAFDLDINGAVNIGGIPTILTAAPGTNTTQAASTAFVQAAVVAATAGVSSLNGLTGGLSVVAGTGISVSAGGSSVTVATNLSTLTNSLSGDVTLNNTATFFSGPTVAQGTSGKWCASGAVSAYDSSTGANFNAILWDGTTVIASGASTSTAANKYVSFALSGCITSPAGNIRIDVKDATSTNGVLAFSGSGQSKDSTVTVFRVQ